MLDLNFASWSPLVQGFIAPQFKDLNNNRNVSRQEHTSTLKACGVLPKNAYFDSKHDFPLVLGAPICIMSFGQANEV